MRLYLVRYQSKTCPGQQAPGLLVLLYQLSYGFRLSTASGGARTRDLGIKSAKYGRTTTPGQELNKCIGAKSGRYLLNSASTNFATRSFDAARRDSNPHLFTELSPEVSPAYGTQYKHLFPVGATVAGPVGAALPMRIRPALRQHFGSRTRDRASFGAK